jgi:hypothetical protein
VVRDDEHAPALLRKSVIGRVDDAPFNRIAKLMQRRQNDGDVTPFGVVA